MRSTAISLGGALGLVCLGLVATPAPARACGNAVFNELTKKEAIELVKTAEELLASGSYREARDKIARYVGEDEHEGEIAVKGDKKLEYRLYQLRAMTLLHTGDDLGAKELLDKLLTDKPKDPFLQIREAELLAVSPATRDKAKKQLESFAKKDLIVDATAWSTLARLRGQAGDADGKKQALERCQQMAKDPAFCDRPPAPGSMVHGTLLVWASRSHQATFGNELKFAPGCKVSIHDPGGATRTLDLAGFEKDRARQLRGIDYARTSDEKFSLAGQQPKRGELWEARARITYTPSSRRRVKAGDLPTRDYQLQLLYSGDAVTIQALEVWTPETPAAPAAAEAGTPAPGGPEATKPPVSPVAAPAPASK